MPHFLIIVGVTILVVTEIVGLCRSLFALPFPLLALGVSAGITILGISMVHFQLFKPLNDITRITPASEDTRSGAGLGLAFCKLVLEAQEGRIWVESDGRNGATFHFTLPIWIEPAEAPNSASRDSEQDV